MKHALLVLWMVVCCVPLSGQSIEDLSFGTDSTLEVMTWNIERFPKNGFTTIEYVADIVAALDADLVALQEIDDQQSFDAILNLLGDWSGYWDDTEFSGLAYIYQPDVVDVIDVFQIYQGMNRPFPRPPLVMHCSYNGEFLVVINNHLKCCGNGVLDAGDAWDEETRRREASQLIAAYIAQHHPDDRVIVLGDLNDILTDAGPNNVFGAFLGAPQEYAFADMSIAEGSSAFWSYPGWPSHLDHILVSNELFSALAAPGSSVQTIRVDDVIQGGIDAYDDNISDHRPVALRLVLESSTTSTRGSSTRTHLMTGYPNPAGDHLQVRLTPLPGPAELVIMDATGKMHGHIDLPALRESVRIELTTLAPGIYQVVLIAEERSVAALRFVRIP